jgi:steroid 5-alpha reductase family enzyme
MILPFVIALAAMAAALCTLMAAAWMIQQRTGNSGWVDTIWTFATGYVGVVAALWPFGANALPPRRFMVAALVTTWALRLGLHIAVRSAGNHDDPRYAEYARRWGSAAPRKMFVFLQQQALGSLPLVFAIFLAAQVPVPAFRLQDYLGALILFVGIAGEGIADAQLKRFRDNPANQGRVCDAGLWRWSRHPNYFFQWFGWLAYPVIAITPGHPWGFAALVVPLFMYWILNYVTGVPPLEEQMARSRGEAWRAYQARTSRFFLLPPKPEELP